MNVQNRANEAMAVLRQSYRDKLCDRIIAIENASVRLNQEPGDSSAISSLRRECHKLSGISHSLGFVLIGELATKIDCAISVDNSPWADLHPLVEDLLDYMEGEID